MTWLIYLLGAIAAAVFGVAVFFADPTRRDRRDR
jgi:hypothetical protein